MKRGLESLPFRALAAAEAAEGEVLWGERAGGRGRIWGDSAGQRLCKKQGITHVCSRQHYSQEPRGGNNPGVHRWVNE